MASEKERVYNREIAERTYSHNFTATFGEIVRKDSPGSSFGFTSDVLSMLCLDHDAVEISRPGSNEMTVDCSTVVSSLEEATLRLKNHRHLFIELKLNCKAHNLKKADYQGKIDHSLVLIQDHCNHISNVHPDYVFLFTDAVKGRAIRDVNGWSRGSGGSLLKRVVILGPTEFNEYIRFPHQFPYNPKNSQKTIEDIFQQVRNLKEDCLEALDNWYKRAVAYGSAGLTLEQQHIAKTVVHILETWLKEADEGQDMEIEREYLEEFENLLVKVDGNS